MTSRRPRAPHPVPISQGHRLMSFTANGIECLYSNRRGNVKRFVVDAILFKQIAMLCVAILSAERVECVSLRAKDLQNRSWAHGLGVSAIVDSLRVRQMTKI